MRVVAVDTGHKREKEKTCNDVGFPRVIGSMVNSLLREQGISCRWPGKREQRVGVKEMRGSHLVILIHRCGKTCGLLKK